MTESGTSHEGGACPIFLIYCSYTTRLKSLNVFMTQRFSLGVIGRKLEKVGYFGAQWLKDRPVFSNDFFPILFGEMCFFYHRQCIYIHS